MRTRAIPALLLVGCASSIPIAPTPYQPYRQKQTEEHAAGGYLDEDLGGGLYLVTFRGSVATAQEDVIAYAYERAGELCGGAGRFDVMREEDASRESDDTEVHGGAFNNAGWVTGHASAETTRTVWPRRRLMVRCK